MENNIEKFIFTHPSTCYVAGPTECVKTSLMLKVLKEKDVLFDKSIDRIVGVLKLTKIFLMKRGKICSNIEFYEGICNVKEIKKGRENIVLVLDDLMKDMNKEVAEIFTVFSHYMLMFVIF